MSYPRKKRELIAVLFSSSKSLRRDFEQYVTSRGTKFSRGLPVVTMNDKQEIWFYIAAGEHVVDRLRGKDWNKVIVHDINLMDFDLGTEALRFQNMIRIRNENK